MFVEHLQPLNPGTHDFEFESAAFFSRRLPVLLRNDMPGAATLVVQTPKMEAGCFRVLWPDGWPGALPAGGVIRIELEFGPRRPGSFVRHFRFTLTGPGQSNRDFEIRCKGSARPIPRWTVISASVASDEAGTSGEHYFIVIGDGNTSEDDILCVPTGTSHGNTAKSQAGLPPGDVFLPPDATLINGNVSAARGFYLQRVRFTSISGTCGSLNPNYRADILDAVRHALLNPCGIVGCCSPHCIPPTYGGERLPTPQAIHRWFTNRTETVGEGQYLVAREREQVRKNGQLEVQRLLFVVVSPRAVNRLLASKYRDNNVVIAVPVWPAGPNKTEFDVAVSDTPADGHALTPVIGLVDLNDFTVRNGRVTPGVVRAIRRHALALLGIEGDPPSANEAEKISANQREFEIEFPPILPDSSQLRAITRALAKWKAASVALAALIGAASLATALDKPVPPRPEIQTLASSPSGVEAPPAKEARPLPAPGSHTPLVAKPDPETSSTFESTFADARLLMYGGGGIDPSLITCFLAHPFHGRCFTGRANCEYANTSACLGNPDPWGSVTGLLTIAPHLASSGRFQVTFRNVGGGLLLVNNFDENTACTDINGSGPDDHPDDALNPIEGLLLRDQEQQPLFFPARVARDKLDVHFDAVGLERGSLTVRHYDIDFSGPSF